MTGELAMASALVSFGNAFLLRKPLDVSALHAVTYRHNVLLWFWPTAPADVPEEARRPCAFAPEDWFRWLADQGATRLTITRPPEREKHDDAKAAVLSAFANGTTALIFVEGAHRMLWRGYSQLGSPFRELPWVATWTGIPVTLKARVQYPSAASVGRNELLLRDAITAAQHFCRERNWTTWLPAFERSLQALEADEPEELLDASAYRVLAREVHPLIARRLMVAAQAAWVFGGMMSWNDPPRFDEAAQRRYVAITGDLFAAVFSTIIDAVNTVGS